MHTFDRRAGAVSLAAATSLLALSGCALSDPDADSETASKQVVVATHDSWSMSKQVMQEFTDQTGYTVTVQPSGDAGALTNKLVLTKDSPIADAVYGIDNTFASRAVDEGVLTDYTPSTDPGKAFEPQDTEAADQLTPVDYSDVCVNVDDAWFAAEKVPPPKTLEDLTKPAYKDLFVTPGATTSSPGLAFLLATISAEGDDWQEYWKKLMANGAKVTSGWTDAYEVDFTAGGGNGSRPIVTSYSSSPPFTIAEGKTRPPTRALLDTCFRQVEYAGVLRGSENPKGMQKFIDFMLERKFQAAIPDNMYVYPVDRSVPLPKTWTKYAPVAPNPLTVDPDKVTENRAEWLREWRDITSQ